jgi:NTE family protein
MASAAIPGVFAPVSVDGDLLIDGGVCDNTPISHAIELGAEEIYVLPTGFSCDLDAPPRAALNMLVHAMSVMLAQRLYVEIELYRERARVIVLPPPCPQHVQPIDFSHAGELIDRALAESRTCNPTRTARARRLARTRRLTSRRPENHSQRRDQGRQHERHDS